MTSKSVNAPQPMLCLLDANGQLRSFREMEREIYNFAWHHHRYNIMAIAKSLKISRTRWYRILRQFKFDE